MLKSKLHRVHVKHSELHYDGSCAKDETLHEAANLYENEQIHLYNVTNGERFSTYAIRAEHNSGIFSVNGAAAHKASPHDILIIASYAIFHEDELKTYLPQLGYVDELNRIQSQRNANPVQAA